MRSLEEIRKVNQDAYLKYKASVDRNKRNVIALAKELLDKKTRRNLVFQWK